ncbi:MAG: 23S rRNA (uracil(1939)-C(5))-methyltransferase RlmD [Zoogloeaceae bacterium]|jgi:23S rRNA (uracil1939-C5)-methyltransferase|nr:23S rRNA (uracil(1939)-C(5))-methyltransferase RlmD [Zoogloeaceae bacterium]
MPIGQIEALDHEARGIARQDGKAIFIEGALPGETAEYASYRKKPHYEQAQLVRVLRSSALRVHPRCPHFGICGGCVMQHLDVAAQVAVKQRVLEDSLWHIGRVRPGQILPPIRGIPWGYRHKARLGVRKVPKKGGMLIGFHEKRSSYIADIKSCAVLHPAVSRLLLPLRELVGALSIAERLPQIEVAVGDACVALALRVLEPLALADEEKLRAFADRHHVVFYLQPKGPDTVFRFYPGDETTLSYRLPEFDLDMAFLPTDFTQVNHGINQVLVRHALALLDPQPGEVIADLFCGIGNFTLPIARRGARAIGVEGNNALVERAEACARANRLSEQARFIAGNLFECSPAFLSTLGPFDKLLLDPPREGALEVVKALPDAPVDTTTPTGPWRIVYVSCNPATLARDAAILVGWKGYRFMAAGAINMFPHTAHVESIAVFERPAMA